MTSLLIFAAGAALLVYSAEKLTVHLVGAAHGLHVSVFLLAIIFTGIMIAPAAIMSSTTLVLSLEDIFLTVGPNRRGAPEIGIGNVIGSAVFGRGHGLDRDVLAGAVRPELHLDLGLARRSPLSLHDLAPPEAP